MRCGLDCGLCYSNRRGRSCYAGHWGYGKQRKKEKHSMADFLRKKSKEEKKGPLQQDFTMCEFAKRYPCLHEWLTLDKWEDGTHREPSTLLLFLDDGRPKGCLNDREGGKVVFVAAWTFTDVLVAMEEGLLADTLDWRTAKKEKGRSPR